MKRKMLLLLAAVMPWSVLLARDAKVSNYAGKQVELCMIGDSITWAPPAGDSWRGFLVKEMPELAFVGTHTSTLGYSHAGEGGNSTPHLLARIDNRESIPDSRYYHLLIGVNDNAGANAKNVPERARKTVNAIVEIVRHLEARPCTEKIFLGSLLPCANPKDPDDVRYIYRDAANQESNKILRAEFQRLFPSGKVVWVEYENVVRPLPNWRQIIQLHPTEDGYKILAKILADVLKKETTPASDAAGTAYGVMVKNLWNADENRTESLIPGYYVISFDVDAVDGQMLQFTVESQDPQGLRFPFRKDFHARGSRRRRAEVEFYTGAEGYGYSQCAMVIRPKNGKISRIMVEKMRPTRRASRYGEGSFVDASSVMSPGEKLVPAKRCGDDDRSVSCGC